MNRGSAFKRSVVSDGQAGVPRAEWPDMMNNCGTTGRWAGSMSHLARTSLTLAVVLLGVAAAVPGGEPLHERIDALVEAKSGGRPAAGPADDPEFLRRVYL